MTQPVTAKILMVLTSHSELGNTGEKTGFWVEEFAAPYYAFVDAGIAVTLASPAGGLPPIDPKSKLEDFQTAATKRFDADEKANEQLSSTVKLDEVNVDEFDAVFYPGGHGPLWDLTDNAKSIALIQQSLSTQKPVAAVCHASAVFLNVKDDNGEFVLKDKSVTGFSNTEEGGNYQKGDDWTAFTVQDGLIITGQNPASSEETAKKLIALIQ